MPTGNSFNSFVSDNDGALYHRLALCISDHYTKEVLTQKFPGGLFPIIVGTIYHFIAANPFIITIINSIVSSFSAILFYLISREVIPDRNNLKIYVLLTILCTSYIVNTSVMIRDSYIVFFMYLSIFLSILFFKKKNIFWLIGTASSLFLLYKFRPYACYVICFAILSAYCISNLKFSFKNKVIKTNSFSFVVGILSPIIIIGVLGFLAYIFSSMNFMSLEDLMEFRNSAYSGGSSDINWDFIGLYNKFFLLPFIFGYIYLFFAPFPWEWISPKRIHYIPDMIILYFLLPSFFKNLLIPFKTRNYTLLVYVFSILFMFSIYCITLGNTGAIHRLRGPFIPMIYLIAFYNPRPILNRILCKIKKLEVI